MLNVPRVRTFKVRRCLASGLSWILAQVTPKLNVWHDASLEQLIRAAMRRLLTARDFFAVRSVASVLSPVVLLGACAMPGTEPGISAQGGAVLRLPEEIVGTELVTLNRTWISHIDGQPIDTTQRAVRVSPGEHSIVVVNRRCAMPLLIITCKTTETLQQRTLLFTAFPGASYNIELDPFRIRDARDGRIVSLY